MEAFEMKTFRTSIAAAIAATVIVSGSTAAPSSLASSAGAAGPARSLGSMSFRSTFAGPFEFGSGYCLPDTPAVAVCIRFVTRATVPGLGRATATYVKTLGDPRYGCDRVTGFATAIIDVAGKGQIHASIPRVCTDPAPAQTPLTAGFITGGSGAYAEASGSVEFSSNVSLQAGAKDLWSVALTVPRLEFDLTPPVLSGHKSLVVRAPRVAKRAAVRYSVTALDAVDGSLPVSCLPRSGSRLAIGRTRVTCSAEDTSANKATVSFTVVVRSGARR